MPRDLDTHAGYRVSTYRTPNPAGWADSASPRVSAAAAAPALDALGFELCFSVSYLSATTPEIVFAQILGECGLELSMRGGGGFPGRDVFAEIAVEFGLAVVFDGMPAATAVPAVLADVAAPFAVTVSVAAANRRRVA